MCSTLCHVIHFFHLRLILLRFQAKRKPIEIKPVLVVLSESSSCAGRLMSLIETLECWFLSNITPRDCGRFQIKKPKYRLLEFVRSVASDFGLADRYFIVFGSVARWWFHLWQYSYINKSIRIFNQFIYRARK